MSELGARLIDTGLYNQLQLEHGYAGCDGGKVAMFYCRYSYDWGEVMNSFDSMKTKLESTGLYKVTAKSNIRAELLAYAEGLNTGI